MKIFYFLFFIFFLSASIFSQEKPPAYGVTNYAPKSPEAAAFLQYGQYPVNLSTGVPNISIPIYTVNVDGFSLPITLDYHAGGIKVNQQATWVGLGWNLNYGAQIILSVRGEVDENQNSDNMPAESQLTQYYQQNPYQFIMDSHIVNFQERDIYMFSSPTVNGQFYYKPSVGEYIVYPPDAFKVEKVFSDIQGNIGGTMFKITDSSGYIYKLKTFEESYAKFNHNIKYTSAWYVDEIETPRHDFINFYYDEDGISEEYNFSDTAKSVTLIKNCGDCYDPTANPYSETSSIGPLIRTDVSTYTEVKKISEISFNKGYSKIFFKRSYERQDLNSGQAYGVIENYTQSKLSYIKIGHKNDLTSLGFNEEDYEYVKGYELKHSYFKDQQGQGSGRLRLDEFTTLLDGFEGHRFVYSDEKFKGNLNSQDYYGYYNGINNNAHLIPSEYLPSNNNFGNGSRNVSTTSILAEMLTEIHYPTKGWSKFNYENNQYFDRMVAADDGALVAVEIQGVGNEDYWDDYEEGIDDIYCPGTCIMYDTASFVVNNSTTGQLSTTIIKQVNPEAIHLNQHHYGKVTLRGPSGAVYTSGQNSNIPVTLQPGHWTLTAEAWGATVKTIGALTYELNNNIFVPQNSKGAGLRIASIESYDKEGDISPQARKEFSYLMPSDSRISSGRLVNPEIEMDFTTRETFNFLDISLCAGERGELTSKTNYEKFHNITSSGRNGVRGESIVYEYVKETDINVNDASKNGYTLHKFTTEGDWFVALDAGIIPTPWKRGKPLEKIVFRTVGNTDYPLRKEVNTYAENTAVSTSVEGYKYRRRAYGYDGMTDGTQPSTGFLPNCNMLSSDVNFVFYRYDMDAFWNYLQKTEVTENFYDSQNVLKGKLTTTKRFFYDNPLHMQLSREEITTSQGESLITKYYYPLDPECAGEPEVAMLNAKHMLNIPLITESWRNGVKLGGGKTIYKKWCDNNNDSPLPTDPGFRAPVGNQTSGIIVLPELIQSFKSNDSPETRLRTIKVDCDGNVLELKQENGISICYIYGYGNRLPVAKIENYNYDAIPASAIGSIQQASDSGDAISLETEQSTLRAALANTQALVTTYIHYPLTGVASVTDPRGRKTQYEYDNEARLRNTKDNDGNLLQENIYYFKP